MEQLSSGQMLQGDEVDATANRERMRQRRLRRTLLLLAPICAWLVYRLVTNNQIRFGMPGWLAGNPEIVIALGMKTYARIQKYSFYAGMLGLLIVIVLLFTGSRDAFPHTSIPTMCICRALSSACGGRSPTMTTPSRLYASSTRARAVRCCVSASTRVEYTRSICPLEPGSSANSSVANAMP